MRERERERERRGFISLPLCAKNKKDTQPPPLKKTQLFQSFICLNLNEEFARDKSEGKRFPEDEDNFLKIRQQRER